MAKMFMIFLVFCFGTIDFLKLETSWKQPLNFRICDLWNRKFIGSYFKFQGLTFTLLLFALNLKEN